MSNKWFRSAAILAVALCLAIGLFILLSPDKALQASSGDHSTAAPEATASTLVTIALPSLTPDGAK